MRDSLPSIRRFSTDDLPEQSRPEVFREVYGRTIIKIDIEPLPEHPFRFDALFCSLPGIGVAAGSISPSRGVLTSNLIDSDDILLNISLSGGRVIQQRGRETDIVSGEGALTTSIDPGVVTIHSPSRFFSFRVARTLLLPMIGDLDACLLRPIPRNTGALQLLTCYAGLIEEHESLVTPAVRNLVATHFQDLISVTLGATRDAAELAAGRGVRAARLRVAKNDIMENLTNSELSIDTLAKRQGISGRYLRMLFADEATSFSEFVLASRLARAHRTLIDPRYAAHAISAVSFACGFSDLSYFNRTFRRRYGATPSDIREAARRERI